MVFKFEIQPGALTALKRTPRDVRRRLVEVVDALEEDPKPPGAKKVQGTKCTYRIRVNTRIGGRRILYRFDGKVLLVTDIRPRDEDTYKRTQ